jgi:hypothetical protein
MATVEYIVTDSDVGRVFPSDQHFLVGLVRSRPPAGDCYSRPWMERHFILRDKSPQNLFCIDATTSGKTPLVVGGALFYVLNNCIPFFGALRLVACPTGSEWEVTISDIWVQPRAPGRRLGGTATLSRMVRRASLPHPCTCCRYPPRRHFKSLARSHRPSSRGGSYAPRLRENPDLWRTLSTAEADPRSEADRAGRIRSRPRARKSGRL